MDLCCCKSSKSGHIFTKSCVFHVLWRVCIHKHECNFALRVACRSPGEQHAPEASWSPELPEESPVGVVGVHRGHHRPGCRCLQWVSVEGAGLVRHALQRQTLSCLFYTFIALQNKAPEHEAICEFLLELDQPVRRDVPQERTADVLAPLSHQCALTWLKMCLSSRLVVTVDLVSLLSCDQNVSQALL